MVGICIFWEFVVLFMEKEILWLLLRFFPFFPAKRFCFSLTSH